MKKKVVQWDFRKILNNMKVTCFRYKIKETILKMNNKLVKQTTSAFSWSKTNSHELVSWQHEILGNI